MDILQPGGALVPRVDRCDLLGMPRLGNSDTVSTGARIDLCEWIDDGARLTLHAAEAPGLG